MIESTTPDPLRYSRFGEIRIEATDPSNADAGVMFKKSAAASHTPIIVTEHTEAHHDQERKEVIDFEAHRDHLVSAFGGPLYH